MTRRRIIRDDFAGPGGWSEGLRLLGLREDYAIEYDPTSKADPQPAVATARAAGHRRWQADVTSTPVRTSSWSQLGITLYIASPPCQTFSMAGGGSGRRHLSSLMEALRLVAHGARPENAVSVQRDDVLDVRSVLVLEPMLVIKRHHPLNVALEQVPPVLPIWQAYAEILREMGYSVWTGYMHSEQYGVPQTRKRAVLMASLQRDITGPPTPTHSRYYPQAPDRLDDGVKSWVSMAEALGTELTMRSNYGTGGDPTARGERSSDQPAPTVTSKIDRNKWVARKRMGAGMVERYGERPGRGIDQPAFTVRASAGGMEPGGFRFDTPEGTRRVSVREAGILQSFPADYPWQGTKGQQFQQVGNAVPPLMAAAIIATVLGLDIVEKG